MSDQANQQLQRGIEALGLLLDQQQQGQLMGHLQLLKKWNTAYNLTAITDVPTMITDHTLDSLAVVPYVTAASILDMGAGGGFPGIPLAIAMPDTAFTLLDSNGKKTRFLTQVAHELGLKNVTVVHARVESYREDGCFDAIISRAVGDMAQMIKGSRHLLKTDGHFYWMKGQLPSSELEQLDRPYSIQALEVPGQAKERHLITVDNEG